MQVICNTEDFQITEKTAVTLGKFDGIHKGHQRLLNALLEKKKQGLKTVVFTFFVPPIPGCEDVRQLTPNDEKKKFTDKINSHFTTMQHEMQHEKEKTP